MTFTPAPWIENALILAPFVFALGFLMVENPVAYGLAGLAGSGFALFFGYHLLHLKGFFIFAVYAGAISFIGAWAGMIHRSRIIRRMQKTGVDISALEDALAPTPIAIITGTVHDAGDPDALIPGTIVKIGNTDISTAADSKGMYKLEIEDTSFIIKKKLYIVANHSGYYETVSKPIAIKGGTVTTLGIPLQHLISPAGALSKIRVILTDDHGKVISPEMKPNQRFGCRIIAEAPLTFDRSMGKQVPHDAMDRVELVDQETGQPLLMLTEESLPTQGTIQHLDDQTIYVTSTIPHHYLDGPGNTPKTPIYAHKDLKVKIIAHLNIT